jgi:hypothetical protein
MDTTTLFLGAIGCLLMLIVLMQLERPSAPPPAPSLVVMPPAPSESSSGCGITILTVLLSVIAFAMLADFLGLINNF